LARKISDGPLVFIPGLKQLSGCVARLAVIGLPGYKHLAHTERGDERRRLEEALQLNRSLAIAYYSKEDLRQFWNQKPILAAERFLDDWCRRADA
jgi:hypothetical protein